jgi:hypothetical protein
MLTCLTVLISLCVYKICCVYFLVGQAGLKIETLLPLPSECWDHSCATPHWTLMLYILITDTNFGGWCWGLNSGPYGLSYAPTSPTPFF